MILSLLVNLALVYTAYAVFQKKATTEIFGHNFGK